MVQFYMIRLRHYFQVVRMVVVFVAVFVVNNFRAKQRPAYFIFSYNPMLMSSHLLYVANRSGPASRYIFGAGF